MKTINEFPRNAALPWIKEILETLKPCCEKLEVVGSYRRGKRFIHDLDFVCWPKKELINVTLFDKELKRTDEFLEKVKKFDVIKGNWATGKQVQVKHESGITIEFHFADQNNYGWIKLLRTGPWEYAKRIAGSTIRKAGYYSEDGLIKRFPRGEIISVPEEINIYQLLKQKYLPPESRC